MTAGRSNHWAEYIVGMKGACRDYVRIVGRHRSYRRSLDYYAGSSVHRKIPRIQRAQDFMYTTRTEISRLKRVLEPGAA